MRVDEMRHLVAHAIGSSDLVDGALNVVSDGWRSVEQHDSVSSGEERRLVNAVGDPVEISLDASNVVASIVEGGAKRRPRDRRIVGQRRGLYSPRRQWCHS